MKLPTEFSEFLQCLSDHGVEYAVVGGLAVAYHGYPRFTGDMDVLVGAGAANAANLILAIDAFGFGSLGLTEDDFAEPDTVVQFGVPPLRIDVMTTVDGVSTEDVIANRVACADGGQGQEVYFISLADLKLNKRAANRPKDALDLENL